jgi:hypothetical protein
MKTVEELEEMRGKLHALAYNLIANQWRSEDTILCRDCANFIAEIARFALAPEPEVHWIPSFTVRKALADEAFKWCVKNGAECGATAFNVVTGLFTLGLISIRPDAKLEEKERA